MENITAAIPTTASAKKLSAEEFRNLLSSWFEEKGIVSDLKSHVRYRMINILKNTAIGRDIVRKSLQKTSLSRQAVNLIVAEYLMQNHYHYSLSIFNTEAGLTDVFPVSGEFNGSSPVKFDPDNVRNIMELIGISKINILCNELLSSYYTDQDASILSSLVTLLHKLTDKRYDMLDNDQYPDLERETNFIKQIGSILIKAKLPPAEFTVALQNLKLCYNVEFKDLEFKHEKMLANLNTEKLIIEEKLHDVENSKKLIERKMIKLAREYKALKSHVEGLVKEEFFKEQNTLKRIETNVGENLEEINEKRDRNVICNLQHCTDRCDENKTLMKELRIENCNLKAINEEKCQEISKLSSKYNELLKDFMDCQNKISLLNSKVNDREHCFSFDSTTLDDRFLNKANDQSSDSSDGVTEQLLKETRMRLKILEEESKAIEENYKTLQHGISQIKL